MSRGIQLRLLSLTTGLVLAAVCSACDSGSKKEEAAEQPTPQLYGFKAEMAEVRKNQEWSKRKSFVRGNRQDDLSTLHKRANLKMNREILLESLDIKDEHIDLFVFTKLYKVVGDRKVELVPDSDHVTGTIEVQSGEQGDKPGAALADHSRVVTE